MDVCPLLFKGIPKTVEENAKLLGDALREKGFGVTQPKVSGGDPDSSTAPVERSLLTSSGKPAAWISAAGFKS